MKSLSIFKKIIFLVVVMAALVGVWQIGAAQALTEQDLGIQYGTGTGLSSTDIRVTIANIIRYALGFVGIVAVGFVLYGGFLWLTSGGNEERVSQAKRTLINGAIGLVIIVTAFAIVTFVLNRLSEATGITAQPCAQVGEVRDCFTFGCAGLQTCQATPQGNYWSSCQSTNPECVPTNSYLRVVGYAPDKYVPIRNVVADVYFNLQLDETKVSPQNIKFYDVSQILKDNLGVSELSAASFTPENLAAITASQTIDQGVLLTGQLTAKGSRVSFKPEAACPEPNNDLKCFAANSAIAVIVVPNEPVGDGLASSGGKSLVCQSSSCFGTFAVGENIDLQDPTTRLTKPQNNWNVPAADPAYSLNSQITDDAGVKLVEYRVYDKDNQLLAIGLDDGEGNPLMTFVDSDPSQPNPLALLWQSIGYWDTTTLQLLENYSVEATAFDYADHTASDKVNVLARPSWCFNDQLDSDEEFGETGPDCGGEWCGACDGQACDVNATDSVCTPNNSICASNYCRPDSCTCQGLPEISQIDKADGAPSNLVTIYGRYFGGQPGVVKFPSVIDGGGNVVSQVTAAFPSALNAACGNTWRNDQIVVVVPEGAISGPVEIVTGTDLGGLSNWTDGVSELNSYFTVNNVVRPGLCRLDPDSGIFGDRVDVFGLGLGQNLNDQDRVEIGLVTAPVNDWALDGQSANVSVPNLQLGLTTATVIVGGQSSNSLFFNVAQNQSSTNPWIDYLSPAQGPIGQYVTIFGRNFGYVQGVVNFIDEDGNKVAADIDFPAACQDNFWQNDQIIVKVPSGLENDSYSLQVVRSSDNSWSNARSFQVTAGTPGPGICRLSPNNGPTGIEVYVFGENLSFTSEGQVDFWENRQADILPNGWQDQTIKVLVPGNALSGPLTVSRDNVKSNQLNYGVGICTLTSCNDQPNDESCSAANIDQRNDINACWLCTADGWRWDDTDRPDCGQTPPLSCCGDGSCVDESAGQMCLADGNYPNYVWAYSTDDIPNYPEVIFECTRRNLECQSNQNLASPSPRTPDWDADRGNEYACVNAVVTARFTTLLDQNTLKSSNIIIERCTGSFDSTKKATTKQAEDACADGNRIALAADDYNIVYDSFIESRVINGQDISAPAGFKAVFADNLQAQTYYQVTLKGDNGNGDFGDEIRSHLQQGNYPLLQDYVWQFRTRDSDELCEVGCVEVIPDPITARETGPLIDSDGNNIYHEAVPDARDNACVALNADDYDWSWQAVNNTDPFSNPYISLLTGYEAGLPVAYRKQANSLGPETGQTPVLVQATETVSQADDSGRLFINFTNPQVMAYWPSCEAACLNAQIGAAFNVKLNQSTLTDSFHLYTCFDDPTCANAVEAGLAAPVYYDPGIEYPVEVTVAPLSAFLPNTYYRVVIDGDVLSASGKPLTNLNYPIANPTSFSWVFKTRDLSNLCLIDRILIAPDPAALFLIPDYLRFYAQPYGAPDSCAPFGQRLQAESFPWSWSAIDNPADPDPNYQPVASISQVATCGNGVVDYGEDCDNPAVSWCHGPDSDRPCQFTGSLPLPAVTTWGASCGNNIVEAGEECDGGDYCNANSCLHSGNANSGAVCGNGLLEVGEGCDNGQEPNDSLTDGCANNCAKSGSVAGLSLCGDGQIGLGEECDGGELANEILYPNGPVSTDGNQCTANCLKQNSAGGLLNPGNTRYDTPVCGNTLTEIGEDCDDGNTVAGDGCSSICLHEGPATSLLAAGPVQIAKSENKGHADITAQAGGICQDSPNTFCLSSADCPGNTNCLWDEYAKSGVADLNVVCGFSENECVAKGGTTFGADSRGCCQLRPVVTDFYPDGENVCRNTLISVDFDQLMSSSTLSGNMIVEYNNGTTPCPQAGGDVSWWSTIKHKVANFVNQSVTTVLSATPYGPAWRLAQSTTGPLFSQDTWCPVRGSVSQEIYNIDDNNQASRLLFNLQEILPPSSKIRVRLSDNLASRAGVKFNNTLVNGQEYIWSFSTGAGVCRLNYVSLDPQQANFFAPADLALDPENDPDGQKAFSVSARTDDGRQIQSVPDLYSWSWQWSLNSPGNSIVDFSADLPITGSSQILQATGQNGSGVVIAAATITADYSAQQLGQTLSDQADLIALMCENPWPERSTFPFSDSADTHQSIFQTGTHMNFATYYCRDAGETGLAGDLPALRAANAQIPVGQTGILRHVLLTHDQADDAILFSAETNPDHLSARTWYGQRFSGNPADVTIDGYRGLREGNTYYINTGNLSSNTIYTGIFIASQSNQSTATTQNIFSQLIKNLTFNVNVTSDNLCYGTADNSLLRREIKVCSNDLTKQCSFDTECSDGAVCTSNIKSCSNRPTQTCNVDDDCWWSETDNGSCQAQTLSEPIACSADIDCRRCTSGTSDLVSGQICEVASRDCPGGDCFKETYCNSDKDKIVRNVARAADLHDIQILLDRYRLANGNFPSLSAGSYVTGSTFDTWPSWQSTLANELGQKLPIDPINQFVGCSDPYNSATCWDEKDLAFQCPEISYAYTYRYNSALPNNDGNKAKVTAQMELLHAGASFTCGAGALWDCTDYEEVLNPVCENFAGFAVNDSDYDGVANAVDNCPVQPNGYLNRCSSPYEGNCCPFDDPQSCCPFLPDDWNYGDSAAIFGPTDPVTLYCSQTDPDNDGLGTVCDLVCPTNAANDPDGDFICGGTADGADNCPYNYNPTQVNSDRFISYNQNADDSPTCLLWDSTSCLNGGGDACDQNCSSPDADDCQPRCVAHDSLVWTWNGFGGQANCCGDDPGENAGYEICGDGIDNDCDGLIDFVPDGDGDSYLWCGFPADCRDDNPWIAPNLAEREANPQACMKDVDEDGYGDSFFDLTSPPTDIVAGTDCNDNNKFINPGAAEICGDGIDNDCNGRTDMADGCVPVSLKIKDVGAVNSDDSYFVRLYHPASNQIIDEMYCNASTDRCYRANPNGDAIDTGFSNGNIDFNQIKEGEYSLTLYPAAPIDQIGSLGLFHGKNVAFTSVENSGATCIYNDQMSLMTGADGFGGHCNFMNINKWWGKINGSICDIGDYDGSGKQFRVWGEVKTTNPPVPYSDLYDAHITVGDDDYAGLMQCYGLNTTTDEYTYYPIRIDSPKDSLYTGLFRTYPGYEILDGFTLGGAPVKYDRDIWFKFNFKACNGGCGSSGGGGGGGFDFTPL